MWINQTRSSKRMTQVNLIESYSLSTKANWKRPFTRVILTTSFVDKVGTTVDCKRPLSMWINLCAQNSHEPHVREGGVVNASFWSDSGLMSDQAKVLSYEHGLNLGGRFRIPYNTIFNEHVSRYLNPAFETSRNIQIIKEWNARMLSNE